MIHFIVFNTKYNKKVNHFIVCNTECHNSSTTIVQDACTDLVFEFQTFNQAKLRRYHLTSFDVAKSLSYHVVVIWLGNKKFNSFTYLVYIQYLLCSQFFNSSLSWKEKCTLSKEYLFNKLCPSFRDQLCLKFEFSSTSWGLGKSSKAVRKYYLN